ncbi:MAG TPA: MFS transporter [Chthoniobacteraceae bacterium]|nr:MFS transporter [Chthoniobacteraceae bacterium]
MSNPYAAFQSRGFRFFLAGNFLSVLGRQMLSVTVGWEVYRRTGSAMALGLIGLAGALPIITLAIPAGHVADRFPRRTIIMINQLVSACTSSALAMVSLTGASVKWIYVLLILAGIARTFGWAARNPFMVNLVPQEDFNNAVTWNSSAFGVSSVLGPALAGVMLVHHPYWIIYAMDAGCAVAFFLFMIPTPHSKGKPAGRPAGFEGLFDGLRFVWSTKVVLATITLDLFAVLFGGATALLPIFADSILHVGAAGLGWLRAAPSFGSICMATILAHRRPMRRPGLTLLFAVTGFGIVTVVFGLSRSFLLSLVMLGFSGAFDNISVVVRHTLIQLLTPDSMRGRVSAVNNVFIGSSNEIGAFESGVTAAWFGAVVSVVGGGVATIVTVLMVAALWKQVARLGPFSNIKPTED